MEKTIEKIYIFKSGDAEITWSDGYKSRLKKEKIQYNMAVGDKVSFYSEKDGGEIEGEVVRFFKHDMVEINIGKKAVYKHKDELNQTIIVKGNKTLKERL